MCFILRINLKRSLWIPLSFVPSVFRSSALTPVVVLSHFLPTSDFAQCPPPPPLWFLFLAAPRIPPHPSCAVVLYIRHNPPTLPHSPVLANDHCPCHTLISHHTLCLNARFLYLCVGFTKRGTWGIAKKKSDLYLVRLQAVFRSEWSGVKVKIKKCWWQIHSKSGGFRVSKNNIFWLSTNGCKCEGCHFCVARVTKLNVKYDCFQTCLLSDSHTPNSHHWLSQCCWSEF